jgi:hypothetical protein
MAVKFKIDAPQTLVFPFGDFMDVNGQYGAQFMYTVALADGQRDKLYATPKLHQQLQDAQVGQGSVLTIAKVEGEGNRMDWVVKAEEEESIEESTEGNNGHPVERAPEPEPESEPALTNGKPPKTKPTFAGLERLMACSLRTSWESWCALEDGPAFSGEDVRAVAITLFIECARKGIALQPAAEEVPF